LIDGLWTAKIEAGGNSTSGVLVFANGKVLGGDSGFVWTGSFKLSGDSLKVDLHVKNYDPSVPPRLFGATEYDVRIFGTVQNEKIVATGTSPVYHGVGVNMVLTRRARL